MNLAYTCFDILLGFFIFLLVNIVGRRGLVQSYSSDPIDSWGGNGLFNIGYRVLAPAVLLMVAVAIIAATFPSASIHFFLPSIYVYWLFRLINWCFVRKRLRGNLSLLLAQAALSIIICHYLFYVTADDPIGTLIPQASDISIEFAILALVVMFQMMAQSPLFRKKDWRGTLRIDCEKFLYEFERLFSNELPERFNEDIALRTLLYTIALAENHYRPPSIRKIERIAAKFGFAKTTGLMQVTSNKPLSDKESVALSLPIIEDIYDEFIDKSNLLSVQIATNEYRRHQDPSFLRGYYGYQYNLRQMLNIMFDQVGGLYGKYSGSNLIKPRFFFSQARSFIEATEYESGNRIVSVHYKQADSRFGNLPLCEWERIGKQDGFLCAVGNIECAVLICSSGLMQNMIGNMAEDEQLSHAFALLAVNGNTAIACIPIERKEAISKLCITYAFREVENRLVDFSQLQSSFQQFVWSIERPSTVQK